MFLSHVIMCASGHLKLMISPHSRRNQSSTPLSNECEPSDQVEDSHEPVAITQVSSLPGSGSVYGSNAGGNIQSRTSQGGAGKREPLSLYGDSCPTLSLGTSPQPAGAWATSGETFNLTTLWKQPLPSFLECVFGCDQLGTEKRGWQVLGKRHNTET